MANENETVEQVCELMTGWENHTWMSSTDHKYIGELAKRILAAHKRELAAKDAEIDRGEREYIRCREELRATRERRDDCEVKMRKALERVTRAENALAAKDAEIAKRDALIKELADILKITSRKYFECEERMCAFCGKKCGRNEANRLIKEAREVVNG